MTATPCRRDGRGLGSCFDVIVQCPQVSDLIEQGHLVGTKVFAPVTPDLKGVHTRLGDFVESELAEVMDKRRLVGDVITHWHRLAEDRKTVVFAVSVAHAVHLRDEFVHSGVRAEVIHGQTPKSDRDEILAKERTRAEVIEKITRWSLMSTGSAWLASHDDEHALHAGTGEPTQLIKSAHDLPIPSKEDCRIVFLKRCKARRGTLPFLKGEARGIEVGVPQALLEARVVPTQATRD